MTATYVPADKPIKIQNGQKTDLPFSDPILSWDFRKKNEYYIFIPSTLRKCKLRI